MWLRASAGRAALDAWTRVKSSTSASVELPTWMCARARVCARAHLRCGVSAQSKQRSATAARWFTPPRRRARLSNQRVATAARWFTSPRRRARFRNRHQNEYKPRLFWEYNSRFTFIRYGIGSMCYYVLVISLVTSPGVRRLYRLLLIQVIVIDVEPQQTSGTQRSNFGFSRGEFYWL